MAIADTKSRVAITIDKGVLERLDAYCKRSGMSRSQYISYCVAHTLDLEQQALNGTIDVLRDALATMAAKGQLDASEVAKTVEG